MTIPAGHRIVDSNSNKSNQCNGCGHVQSERVKFLQYQNVRQACQKKNWPHHKVLCTAILHLSNKAEPKTLDPSNSTFVNHLTPQQHATVVGLRDCLREVCMECSSEGKTNNRHGVTISQNPISGQ